MLNELGKNPVEFPVSDGSAITVSEYAANFLRSECGVTKVKAVRVAGGSYLYMPKKMPEHLGVLSVYTGQVGRNVTWPLTDFLARHVYHFHLFLPGEGRIRHDGSSSFLPGNFTRDAWSEPRPEPQQKQPKSVTEHVPSVGKETIEQQLLWCEDSDLQKSAYRVAAKKLNAQVGPDVVHDVFCELLAAILRGKCQRTEQKDFNGWVIGAVKYKCCEIANPGRKKNKPGSKSRTACVNGDILPDPLEVKLANQENPIRRGDMPDENRSHLSEMDS